MSTNRSDPHALEAFLVNMKRTVIVGFITRERRLNANDGSPCPVVLSLQGARDGALGATAPPWRQRQVFLSFASSLET